MDNKTFHALKSNNRTRTRVSQKIGWLAKAMRGFYVLSLSLSLYFYLRVSLFLSSLGHDIDRTTDAKGQQKEKREKPAAEAKTGTSTGWERMEVTRRVFSENKPPPDIVSITARTSLSKGGFQTKSSLPLSSASRLRSACTKPDDDDDDKSRDIRKSNEMGKINGRVTCQVVISPIVRALNETFT